MPWYKQYSSWVGVAAIAGCVGVYLDGRSTKEQLLTGIAMGLMCIFLQGASVRSTATGAPGSKLPTGGLSESVRMDAEPPAPPPAGHN